jgi:amino acid permease
METSARATEPRAHLLRALGVSEACSIVVGTIIGSGIFLVPAEMMQAVGSATLVYVVWLVGGLLSFFGALTYAELGAMKPEAGGEYVYVRDAYGPLAGFLYAWTCFSSQNLPRSPRSPLDSSESSEHFRFLLFSRAMRSAQSRTASSSRSPLHC